MDFNGKVCYDDEGKFLHTHCMVRDNTQHIESQIALKQSEELFKCLVDNSPSGILYFDVLGNILYANANLLKVVGSPSVEETKKINLLTFQNLVNAKVSDAVRYAIEKKIVVRHECFYKSIWGRESYLRFSITPILEKQGKIDRLMAIVEDITENKLAEKKLIESEKKYRTVADYTSDWEYWIDNNNKYLYISPACKDITGYTVEEFFEDPGLLNDIIYGEDKKLFSTHEREISKRSRQSCNLKFRIVTKEKKIKWIEHKCRAIFDSEGNNTGRRGTNSDITEMQEALEMVRISQKNYFNIFEGVSEGLIYVTKNGIVQDVNSSFVKITGIDRRDLIKRHAVVLAREFLTKGVLKKVMAVIANNLNGKQTVPFELEYNDKLLHITTRTGIEDKGVIGVLRDVTELRNAENLIRESENKFRKVLENIQLLAIMTDLEGNITFCNDYFLSVTGYTRKDILNKRWIRTFIPMEKREEIKTIFDEAVKSRVKSYEYESEIVTSSNERLIISWNNTVIKDSKNVVVGITGIGTDITSIRAKEIQDRTHLSLTKKLQKSSSTHEVYKICLDFILEVTKYESGAICFLENKKFIIQHHEGISESFVDLINDLRIHEVKPDLLNNGNILFIPSSAQLKPLQKIFEKEGYISGIIIPFRLPYDQFGTINLASRVLGSINPLDLNLLKSILEIIQFSIHKALSEEKIFQSRNRYRSVVKSLAEGVVVWNRDGKIITVNDSATEILDVPRDRILEFSIFDEKWTAIKEDYSQFTKDENPVVSTLRTGKPEYGVIMGMKRANGEEYWISINTQPIYDEEENSPSSVVMSFFDITAKLKSEKEISKYRTHLEHLVKERTIKLEQEIEERKKVENALRESESHYRLLTENAYDMILRYVYYPKPGYEYVSPACVKITGYTAKEFYTDPNLKTKLIHPDDWHYLEPQYLKNLKPGEIIELRMFHKDGSLRWIEENLKLNFDDEGNLTSREGIVRDITPRKVADLKVMETLKKEKELSELKSRFITTVSHEFRTPLSTILSSTELIRNYPANWNKQKVETFSDKVIRSVDYLTNLLDDVLSVSMIESDEIKYIPVETDLQFTGAQCLEKVNNILLPTHKVKYKYLAESNTYTLDDKLIKIILTNLLSNAIKYSPKGGEIILRIEEQDSLLITVKDSGIGIPEEDRSKITDSFFRSENVLNLPGSGLGLSIVKRAVEVHGGSMEVNSNLQKGTEVKIKIPVIH